MAIFGLRILLYAERYAQTKEQEERIRLALLAHGADGHLLFPAVFGSGPSAQIQEEPVAADVADDYDRVEWAAPSSEDEWARTQAMLAASRVQVPTADADAGWM